MECSLAVILACFTWSNFYIDADTIFMDHGVQNYAYRRDIVDWYDGAFHPVISEQSEKRGAANPYGRLSLGYQVEMSNLTLSIQAEHTSSLATNHDRGINGIAVRARWFPFR